MRRLRTEVKRSRHIRDHLCHCHLNVLIIVAFISLVLGIVRHLSRTGNGTNAKNLVSASLLLSAHSCGRFPHARLLFEAAVVSQRRLEIEIVVKSNKSGEEIVVYGGRQS